MSQSPNLDSALAALHRDSTAKDLRAVYEQGATPSQLITATGLSLTTVRRRLRKANTAMRPGGRPVRGLPASAQRARPHSCPVVLRHVLARRLAELRTHADLTQAQVARAIGVTALTVLRAEQPHGHRSLAGIQALCTLYDVPVHVREDLIGLWHQGHAPTWWTQQNLHVPKKEHTTWGLRADARRIRGWAEQLVPELVQTPGYARVIARTRVAAESVEMAVAVLLAAQQRARQRGVEHGYVVDEAVIRRCVGGPRVMGEQLTALRALAEQGHLRVLAWSSGHGPPGQAFELCSVPELDTVLYYPRTRTLHPRAPSRSVVSDYQNGFARLWAQAEDPDATVALIDHARALLLTANTPDALTPAT